MGWVRPDLNDLESAPRQAVEGAPEAWLVVEPENSEGLQSLQPGDHVLVLTWLDRARRDILCVHPRGDASRPLEGVFSTRAPHHPNPIGLHSVEITAIEGVRVRHLEALDGTPILDVKPILNAEVSRGEANVGNTHAGGASRRRQDQRWDPSVDTQQLMDLLRQIQRTHRSLPDGRNHSSTIQEEAPAISQWEGNSDAPIRPTYSLHRDRKNRDVEGGRDLRRNG